MYVFFFYKRGTPKKASDVWLSFGNSKLHSTRSWAIKALLKKTKRTRDLWTKKMGRILDRFWRPSKKLCTSQSGCHVLSGVYMPLMYLPIYYASKEPIESSKSFERFSLLSFLCSFSLSFFHVFFMFFFPTFPLNKLNKNLVGGDGLRWADDLGHRLGRREALQGESDDWSAAPRISFKLESSHSRLK